VPNVNIEQIVVRPCALWKLGGFHFNDSKYGDDDLDTGSVEPFRLFLVFNELIDVRMRGAEGFAPTYMLDQSHNVTDPIESLMQSAIELQRAHAQALIVDRSALAAAQAANDALGARLELKRAYTTVSPILAMARLRDRLRKQAPRMVPQYLRRETPPSERRSPNARFARRVQLVAATHSANLSAGV
jgi:L-rhamnose isomerase/sugar isomerase